VNFNSFVKYLRIISVVSSMALCGAVSSIVWRALVASVILVAYRVFAEYLTVLSV
jgi:hypothetical protein